MQEAGLVLLVGTALTTTGCATLRAAFGRAQDAAPPVIGAEPNPGAPSGWTSYTVRYGDTLGRIAACRGVPVSELARVNAVSNPHRLLAGERLQVPGRDRCPTPRAVARAQPQSAKAETAKPAPPLAAAGAPDIERSRQRLEDARARYDAADFEGALRAVNEAAQALGTDGPEALRARCHLQAALAAAGLEDRERAISELRAAFAIDPGLAPAPEDSSPRIEELVAAARAPAPSPGDL